MQLSLEIEGLGMQAPLPGDGAELVAFLSFAVVRGFGARHPLIALADHLHDAYHLRLGPLTTFYEGAVEDAEDEEKLEMAWQPPGPLRESLQTMAQAFAASDEAICRLLEEANAPGLPAQAAALDAALEPAIRDDRRVRLSYTL